MNGRVRKVRKELNLTMEKFGSKLGVTRTAISNIENGNRSVTEQMLRLICKEYNVNEEWLRTGNGNMFAEIDKESQLMIWAGNVLKDESDSFKKRFVNMLMELDESDWESLEKMCLLMHKKSWDYSA